MPEPAAHTLLPRTSPSAVQDLTGHEVPAQVPGARDKRQERMFGITLRAAPSVLALTKRTAAK